MNLKINDLSFSYNSVNTLKGITFEIKENEILGIIGPNGSGKTTLLKCINYKLKPKTGAVLINDNDMSFLSSKEIARNIGVVPQNSSVKFAFTVYDMVMMGRYSKKDRFESENKNDREIVDHCINSTGIMHIRNSLITEISGGEYQRVIIARALAQQPKILLLDEVTMHLDIKHQIEILELVKSLCEKKDFAIIMVLHDLSLAARYSSKIAILKKGKIADFGVPEKVINVDNIKNIYGIEAEISYTQKGNFLNIVPISTHVSCEVN